MSLTKSFAPVTTQNANILVIEDEACVAEIMVALLGSKGFAAKAVATGREGLRLIEAQPWSLVLCDFNLPDVSGGEICRYVKRHPKLNGLPIILMSGKMLESDAQEAADMGAVGFISKPFKIDAFFSQVSAYANKSVPESIPF